MSQISEVSAKRFYSENRAKLADLLNTLGSSIDNDTMPVPKEFVKTSKKKTPRPPNANLIYTNTLNKFGLLDILREFCERNHINKQKLIPISKKLSKILWEDLPNKHQRFFSDLASKVTKEHKKSHPGYKFKPNRKDKKGTIKFYNPETQKMEPTCKPVHFQQTDTPFLYNHYQQAFEYNALDYHNHQQTIRYHEDNTPIYYQPADEINILEDSSISDHYMSSEDEPPSFNEKPLPQL
ncbi:hypothetical protein C1645_780689 [Glomus cerebriforme]|uniref:HMG box domain-containing protein n=1 Tax=Glomus cerebriforme TaxID=658196 RepID=A0A397SIX3_9GLOM|nr:hypothetical protein C1645_780689 [Glomus cerebriforme]